MGNNTVTTYQLNTMNAETYTREDNLQHIFCQFLKLVRDMRKKQSDADNHNGADRHKSKHAANLKVDQAMAQMGITEDTDLDDAIIMFRNMKVKKQR